MEDNNNIDSVPETISETNLMFGVFLKNSDKTKNKICLF